MDTPMSNMNTPSASDMGTSTGSSTGGSTGTCAHCGKPITANMHGLEQFLGRVGISDDVINNLKSQFQNVDVDQYLNTARDYLKGNSGKAKDFAKENPGKIAAGVAVLAVGASLLISAMNKD
jgi:hypothetical protein